MCYVCAERPATGREAGGAPVCARCARDVLGGVHLAPFLLTATAVVVDKEPAAAKPEAAVKEIKVLGGREYHVGAWRDGGCVVCGAARRDSKLYAHDACWGQLALAERRHAKEACE